LDAGDDEGCQIPGDQESEQQVDATQKFFSSVSPAVDA
jgi:hypothetical protein